MSEAILRELAENIVTEQLLLNWRFYLVLLALLLVAVAASTFLAAYFNRRGEQFATRADFDELLKQLRATTEAAEKVRTEISHADWTAREWKTIRRIKLEELLLRLYETQEWLSAQKDIRVFANMKTPTDDPQPKFELVCRLYFPELWTEVLDYCGTANEAKSLLARTSIALLQARDDHAARLNAIGEFSEQWNLLYKQSLQRIFAIEQKTPGVLKAVMGA